MNPRIKTLRTELATLTNQAKALYAEIESTPADKRRAEDVQKLDNLIAEGEAKRKELQRLEALEANDEAVTGGESGERKTRDSGEPRQKTWGQTVIESDQFKSRMSRNDGFGPVEVKNIIVGVSGVSGGNQYFVQAQRDGVYAAPRQEITVLDLLTIRRTSSNAVEYVQNTTRTNNAAETEEAAAKPQSDLVFALVTEPVRTIATYLTASRQVLDDEPQLMAMIDEDLPFMLNQRLQTQIINGNGAAPNLRGILNVSGIATRVHATSGARFSATDTRADTIKRMLTDIQLAFFAPDGILLHPADAEKLELEKDTTGQYIKAYDAVTLRIWRVPVVVNTVIPAGTALAGAWRAGARLWVRDEGSIRTGEPNDHFRRNLVDLLLEIRAAFGVPYPGAFARATGL